MSDINVAGMVIGIVELLQSAAVEQRGDMEHVQSCLWEAQDRLNTLVDVVDNEIGDEYDE